MSGEPRAPRYPPVPRRRPSRGAAPTVLAGLAAGIAGAVIAAVILGDPSGTGGDPEPDPQPAVAPVELGAVDDRVAAVAEAVLPAVVRVDIDGRTASGNGSGVVYRSDGLIVTNHHVVASGDDLTVVFADGVTEPAEVVGSDELNDLAVLSVDGEDLPTVAVGAAEGLRVGELAVAVGSPFGLEGTVTAGVISALDRGIDVDGPSGASLTLPRVIQTDAPINPGNSGGPLVDGRGRLIGINSAILTAGRPANAGVGFAIPVDIVADVADELIDHGVVVHPFLGVEGETVEGAEAAELGVDGGAEVLAVRPGSPAEEGGLEAGDVITAVGEQEVTSMVELVVAVLTFEVGEAVEVAYRRGQTTASTTVELAERPSS
ncbi:MAG: S1C family serine protease [Actinomycetota bacterium]